MDRMHVGVAGYMGAGKSVFARFFEQYGFTVIDADAQAKQLMNSDRRLQNELRKAFGDTVLHDGHIDSKQLGTLAFSDVNSLKKLNSIVHPPLKEYLQNRLHELSNSRLIMDAALIPLWQTEGWFQRLYWIKASEKIRLARLSEKLNLDQALIEQRMHMQEQLFSEPSIKPWVIIENNGTLNDFELKIKAELNLLK